MKLSKSLAASVAVLPLIAVTCAVPAFAQDAPQTTGTELAAKETTTEVIVTGRIRFRDRAATDNPTLVYKQDYFQRFEPVSVGEMLKRVPGVAFTSDMLEYDGVSMRGLPAGYTKVLINGRAAPGGGKDRSFFVDRIPAELVDRIEIIRSPSADQPSDGMAGSLNVILKDGAMLKGGLAKIGGLINEDGEVRPSAAFAYAGGDSATSWWVGANYQGRRNPKEKVSWRYDAEGGELDNIEYQDDTRDGTDISLNGELTHRFGGGFVRFGGFAVDTDRDEDETSLTYEDGGTTFEEAEIQAERIKQKTYTLKADGEFEVGPGKLQLDAGWNRFTEDSAASVWVTEEEDLTEQEFDEYTKTDIEDTETSFGAAYVVKTDGWRLKFGADLLQKDRDGAEVEWDIEDGELDEPDPAEGAVYAISEKRTAPYVRMTFYPTDKLTIDTGLRYEMTDREVTSDGGTESYDENVLAPSLHFTYRATQSDQFRLSFARTIRRPDFDFLAPYEVTEEPTDEDALAGNPALKNEKAFGIDAGYERRLGQQGIFGVNLFYRDIEDVVSLVNTGEDVEDDGDLFRLYQPRNIGKGKTWGVEFDFSSPLTRWGMPDTGVFFNYTWMDSEITDPFTGVKHRFDNQPSYVYNVGFIQTLRSIDSSFGASLYDRDIGYAYAFDEDSTVEYEPSLEAFFEKRLGKRWVVRLSAHNILNASKDETFRKFDGDSIDEILENRLNNDLDEYEVETEKSGVLYQVTLRATF